MGKKREMEKKKKKQEIQLYGTGMFQKFPRWFYYVTRVENHCWRVNLKRKEENECYVATKKV